MQEGDKVVISEQDFRRRFVYNETNLLGEGGFAKVYQAYDRQFDETVALKFYTNTDAAKYDIISEMRSSRRFTHKNIIRVHDARIVRFTNSFGLTEDVQVGILEFANSGNFQDFLHSTPSEAVFKEVIMGVLHGLHYLHTEKRVIHRDLSPDNILMMKENGVWIPKIADFGISKEIDLKTLNLGSSKVSSELVGKMEYMAPEQYDPVKFGVNQRITTNVDLWSFGIILAEVFIEKTPFGDRKTAQGPMEIMHNVLHNALPSSINDIPEPYLRVIKSCLVKDAKRRAQSSLELIEMLAAPVKKEKRSNSVWVVTAVIILLLLAFGAWYFFTPVGENDSVIKPEGTIVENRDQPKLGSEKDSLTQLPSSRSPLTSPLDTSGSNMQEADADTPTENDLPDDGREGSIEVDSIGPVESQQPTVDSAEIQKKIMFKNLSREIKSLDNEIVDTKLQKIRASSIIKEYFVDNEAKVHVSEDGKTNVENVEDFLKYIVNSAGDEEREWKIDTLQTRLSSNKISILYLKKY